VIQSGSTLAHYEILSALGKGGMGEVWRARDTKLGREVAIKTLPAEFAMDVDRLARFKREARLLASLNHPNIAAIYGFEEDGGTHFLVMEVVEGDTLAQRVGRGAIPIEESLRYAARIADALSFAHDRGVIHRDLKPANIKFTADDQVKVLDFGLAKAFDPENSEAPAANSPAISMNATQQGVILGTAAYMAPEQARGKPVDKRADIWAFAVVLYEMVTGRRLFAGEDLTDTLASVVKVEPDLSEAPRRLHRLFRRCLEKDPKRRLRDIGDVWELLEDDTAASGGQRPAMRQTVAAGVVSLIAASVVLGIGLWLFTAAEPDNRPLIRFDVDLGEDVSLSLNDTVPIALSADGTRLAYVASLRDGVRRLFTRRLDQAEATVLPGTEGANGPFFSPDGQSLGFQAGDEIRRVAVEGGAVLTIAEGLPQRASAVWGEDGFIVIGGFLGAGLFRVPESGGELTVLTPSLDEDVAFQVPQFLPGGNQVLFTVVPEITSGSRTNRAEVLSLDDGERKVVLEGATNAQYLPSGHLVYQTNGAAYAIAFDLEALEARGNAVPVIENVSFNSGMGISMFAASDNGMAVFHRGGSNTVTVEWLDAAGNREPVIETADDYFELRLSPEADRIAFGDGLRAAVYDLVRGVTMPLTFEPGLYVHPTWAPSGEHILFLALSGPDELGMYSARADGGGQPELLTGLPARAFPNSISPDGRYLAVDSGELRVVPLEENAGSLRALAQEAQVVVAPFNIGSPRFSPDGRWLAYLTDETGRRELSVSAFPLALTGISSRIRISDDGGFQPVWSRNANQLYYQPDEQPGGPIMVVDYRIEGDRFVADRPRVWVEDPVGQLWDMAPDGRALLTVPVESEAGDDDHHLVFMQNFLDEVRRRVPIDPQ